WGAGNPCFHAGGDGRQRKSRHTATTERGCRGADHTGEHLSSLSASGTGGPGEGRRSPPLQWLGSPYPDRQRRLPGILARGHTEDIGGRGPVPVAYRRIAAPVHPGKGDGH